MTIKIGDRLPDAKLSESFDFDPTGCPMPPRDVSVAEAAKGKKIVIFGLPGAYTPTCSAKHVPSYVANLDKLKAKGVNEVWCVAVNDGFVMNAWGRDEKASGKIRMLGDGSADLTKKLGLELDLSARGMGLADAALLDAGRRRRGEAAQRRGPGQVRGLGRRDHARPARLSFDRPVFAAGSRAAIPLLFGVAPFGLITGVAMVASGIPPLAAVAMSLAVFAGASMLAATQLLTGGAPLALALLAVLFVNLRFMMYSASLRQHFAGLPLRWRLLVAGLVADNPYGVCIARFTEHPEMRGKLWYFLGVALPVWLAWQLAVLAGAVLGAGLPAAWQLDFAAPLAFIAMSVPLLRDRGTIAAALAAGTTVVLAHALPLRLGLLLAALAGIAAGLAFERRTA